MVYLPSGDVMGRLTKQDALRGDDSILCGRKYSANDIEFCLRIFRVLLRLLCDWSKCTDITSQAMGQRAQGNGASPMSSNGATQMVMGPDGKPMTFNKFIGYTYKRKPKVRVALED
uniref:AlNc14C632G12295 protein n=1 Tax=Albugo laibachii Nc14 TaxID=890382 RepID=F0X1J3_9STRA|nr:AlNc14C632G12295 [Albugo laibachii Nc14]|eukprot:CCA27682.1 AlNc14C632G12295 [Albugo laibachii Nc14]